MGIPVSIIVPIFNVEELLPRCLDSIINQTLTDFECILVNDASPDNSDEICKKYAQKDRRIKIIRNEHNMGLPLARKTGFEQSAGEYIMHVDSDDYIEPDMAEKLYLNAKADDYDMVYCDYYYHKSNIINYIKAEPLLDDAALNIKNHILGFSNSTVVWNKLVKNTIYQKIEFPTASHGEDKYISMQLFYFSKKIAYVDAALYHAMNNPYSLSNNPRQKYIRYNNRKNNYNKIFNFIKEKYGDNLSIFEPELTKRIKWVKRVNPKNPAFIVRNILKDIIPDKMWNWLRSIVR